MNAKRAAQIIGLGDTHHTIAQMRFALSLHPWRNSHEDNQRLLAAEFALKNWRAFEAARRERREELVRRVAPRVGKFFADRFEDCATDPSR